jgi:hypothetical protein
MEEMESVPPAPSVRSEKSEREKERNRERNRFPVRLQEKRMGHFGAQQRRGRPETNSTDFEFFAHSYSRFCVSSKARRGMGRKANFFTNFYGGSKFIQILFSFIF